MCLLFTSLWFRTLFPVNPASISLLYRRFISYCFLNSFFSFFSPFFFPPPLEFLIHLLPLGTFFPSVSTVNPHSPGSDPLSLLYSISSCCHQYRCSFHMLTLPLSCIFPEATLIQNLGLRASTEVGFVTVSPEIRVVFFPKLGLSFSCIPSLIWLSFTYFLSWASLLFENKRVYSKLT